MMKADAKGDHLAVTLHNALDLSSIPHVESHNSRSDDVSSFTSGSVPISHVPRGWERKPVSPNQQHRRGRKVWKREDAEPFVNAQASAQLLSDLSADATGHDTKRQRTQQIPTLPAKASKQLQYAAIGTDPPVNTPKSMFFNIQSCKLILTKCRESCEEEGHTQISFEAEKRCGNDTFEAKGWTQELGQGDHCRRAKEGSFPGGYATERRLWEHPGSPINANLF